MSKMSQLAHEMDERNTFSAWSADKKTEVQLEAPINPDRIDVDDYPIDGSICFLEPHEIHTIHFLSENTDDEYDRIVLKQIYERVK
jgi:hypothetical protein